jgi:hypothetical protein
MEGTQPVVICEGDFQISLTARLFVYIGSSLVNIYCCYALYKVYPKAKSHLLVYLTILFIIVNIATCTWQYSDENYNKMKCSQDFN